jgi:hypothetical protein
VSVERTSRVGVSGRPLFGTDTIGPLAARLGLHEGHALAARREAERAEARCDLQGAVDHWRLSILIQPGEPAAWRGMARTVRALGGTTEADFLERAARALEPRRGA